LNETESLQRWCELYAPPLDVELLAPLTLTGLLNVTETDYGFLLLKDPDTDSFVVRAIAGLPEVVSLRQVESRLLAPLSHIHEPILMELLPVRSRVRSTLERLDDRLTEGTTTLVRRAVSVCLPLHDDDSLIGLVVTGVLEPLQPAALRDPGLLTALQGQVNMAFDNALVYERTCLSLHQIVQVFAETIDARGPHPRGHSKSASYYAALIGQQLGLSDSELETLELAGYLHDVGTMFVPERILQKPGKLTEEEFEQVRTAVTKGADLLAGIAGLEQVGAVVRHHTECWDGSGYPDGLKGEEIPLGSRILAGATRFAAMLSQRAYRRAMTLVNGAMVTLTRESGKTLDPAVVRALLSAMGRSTQTIG